ncbi:MAG: zinc ribbon domain-containing protein [Elusimicrobiota bacterium]|jgi:hypothetical protein
MPKSKYARIVCTKCGQIFAAPGYACSKCQAPLTKLCGNCGFSNSVAKNYCDRCGTPMALDTEAGSMPAPDPSPFGPAMPAPPRPGAAFPAASPQIIMQSPAPRTETSMIKLRRRDARQALLFWLPVLGVVLLLGSMYLDQNRAERAAPRAAVRYLTALRQNDLAGAYAMFSREAKAHCAFEEFRALRDDTPWTWDHLSVARSEPGAVTLKYQLRINGADPVEDYIVFIHENGAWVRPFNWNLLQKTEDALDRNDPDMALLLAQAAVRINPTDPMARGYLCEASYYRKVPTQTGQACAMALELSRKYPSKLSAPSLFHMRAILGDNYKNYLGKYAEAAAQYDELLDFPDITPQQKCDVLLSRADAYTALGQTEAAARDFTAAAGTCSKPADLEYLHKRQSGDPADPAQSVWTKPAPKTQRNRVSR